MIIYILMIDNGYQFKEKNGSLLNISKQKKIHLNMQKVSIFIFYDFLFINFTSYILILQICFIL